MGTTYALDWDAGMMGCGELVMLLRNKLIALPPGALIRIIAQDPGAREDIPAWCQMTRHQLVEASHPTYIIQRRKDP